MLRGYLREPIVIVVRGVSLIRALGRDKNEHFGSVKEALTSFTSGAGIAIPTSRYVPPPTAPKSVVVNDDWRNFLRITTVREHF